MITIHKSKGLGFGAVIMPFLSWKTDHATNRTNIIWCKPKIAPFDRLHIVPLKYGKKLTETIFREEYLEERLFTYIDNLNMLYVAFTVPTSVDSIAPLPEKLNPFLMLQPFYGGVSMRILFLHIRRGSR